MFVLNLVPVSSGGGLQNAMSFVRASNLEGTVVLARNIPDLLEAVRQSGGVVRVVSGSGIRRLLDEIVIGFSFPRGTKVLTLFGPPLFAPRRYVNLVGCAYSNLFYPEIDFWKDQALLKRCFSRLKDVYRKWSLGRADGWIFETDVLRKRAIELFSFVEDRAFVIQMTAGWWVSKAKWSEAQPAREVDDEFRLLYLTGYHVNKRIESLVGVAKELVARGDHRFKFVLSLDSSSLGARRLQSAAEEAGVASSFEYIGSVSVKDVPDVIASCHAMCNMAVLESFSNNVVEAWASRRPLVITDADWARDSCGDAALYVDPDDPISAASCLQRVADDSGLVNRLIQEGLCKLAALPTVDGRVRQYWDALIGLSPRNRNGISVWKRRMTSL